MGIKYTVFEYIKRPGDVSSVYYTNYIVYKFPLQSLILIFLHPICRDVTVHRLISKNTVEEGMYRCAQGKLKLEEELTGQSSGKDWL